LPLFILPLARLNSSLDVNQRALLQILLGDFRLLAPYNNLVPLGALLALAVAVLVSLVGRDGKIGHCLPATGKSRLGISSQPPDQNPLVDWHFRTACSGISVDEASIAEAGQGRAENYHVAA